MSNSYYKAAFVCFLSVVLTLGSTAQIPEKAKVIAGAERVLEKAAKAAAMPAPGCAVGVSLNGESVFEKAFGLAEMEQGPFLGPRLRRMGHA